MRSPLHSAIHYADAHGTFTYTRGVITNCIRLGMARTVYIYIYIYIYLYIFTHTHVYMVNVRHFWQRNHRAYGHVRYKYTVLANPTHSSVCCCLYPASRVGQNHMCTPYMTVCLVISLPKTPYIYRIYVCMHGFGQPYLLSSS
jgi:hypothetical protein